MKITNRDVIRHGEQDLIDAINGELDWAVLEEIFKQESKLEIGEDVEFVKGDVIIHNNRVAYKLEFDVKVTLSVLLDREGNYISVTTAGNLPGIQEDPVQGDMDVPDKEISRGDSMEDGKDYEAALAELDPTNDAENQGPVISATTPEDPREKISRTASDALQVMS